MRSRPMTLDADLYEALGVNRDAEPADLKKAFRKRAKKAHPDAGGKPGEFEALNRAFLILPDPELRKRYDETGTVEEPKADNQTAIRVRADRLHARRDSHRRGG